MSKKTISSLISVDNISWDNLLKLIKEDTENLATKLLTSKLKEAHQLERLNKTNANQLTDEMKKDIVDEFNAIKDNLTFYKNNVANKGIKLSSDLQKELNSLKEILAASGGLKKEESDLLDSQKEDIKWFNIAILKELFPKILSKSKKSNLKSRMSSILSYISNKLITPFIITIIMGILIAIIYDSFKGPEAYKIYIVGDCSTSSTKHAKKVSTKASQVKEGFKNFNNGRKQLKFEDVPIVLECKHIKSSEDSDKIARELSDPRESTTLAVIGHFNSTLTKEAIQVYMNAQPPIPMFLPTETSTELLSDLPETVYYPIYHLAPNNEDQVEAVIELALKYGNQKFWVIHDNENEVNSSYLTKKLIKILRFVGKSVVRHCSLQKGDSLSVKNVKSNNHYDYEELRPDCVIFIGNSANALALIDQIKCFEDGRPMPTFILTDSSIEHGFVQHGGNNLDGVFVTHPIPPEKFLKSEYEALGEDINMIVTTLVREAQELWRKDSWFWERILNKVKLHRVTSARENLLQAMKVRSERQKPFNDGKLYDKYTFDYYGNNENATFSKWIIDKSCYRDIGKIGQDTMRESAIKLLWPIHEVSTGRQCSISGEKVRVEWRGLEDVIDKYEYIVQWRWGGDDKYKYDEIHKIFMISDLTIKRLQSDSKWRELKSNRVIEENNKFLLEKLKNVVFANKDNFINEIKNTIKSDPFYNPLKESSNLYISLILKNAITYCDTTPLNYYDIPRKGLSGEMYWRVGIQKKEPEDTNKWSGWQSFFFYGDSLDMIKKRGVVRVGVDSGYEGRFIKFDENEKKLKGYDIEIVETIIENLEKALDIHTPLTPVFYGYDWSRLLGAPRRHEVDMIIGMISKNDAREKEYGLVFSDSYLDTCQSFACLSDPKESNCKKANSITDINDLKDKILVIQEGTTARKIATALHEGSTEEKIDTVLVDQKDSIYDVSSTSATFDELLSCNADAVIADYNINLDMRDERLGDKQIDVIKIPNTQLWCAGFKKSKITEEKNLKGKNLVIVKDSKPAKVEAVKRTDKKWRVFSVNNYSEAFNALDKGFAIAIIGDYESIIKEKEKYIEKVTNIKIKPLPDFEEDYGIAVSNSKNNMELIKKINEQLGILKQDTKGWENRLDQYGLKEFKAQKQK